MTNSLSRTVILVALFLVSCATVPYQAMSEARQAFNRAKHYLSQQDSVSPQDQSDFSLAQTNLEKAELALRQEKRERAANLLALSKKHSQAILKRHTPTPTTHNIQFRY